MRLLLQHMLWKNGNNAFMTKKLNSQQKLPRKYSEWIWFAVVVNHLR